MVSTTSLKWARLISVFSLKVILMSYSISKIEPCLSISPSLSDNSAFLLGIAQILEFSFFGTARTPVN